MDNNITIFENNQFGLIRTSGEWFIASDLCQALEHSDVSMACARLDEDEKLIQTLLVSGQNRRVMTVNESGLYHLIMTSRMEKAKEFRKWVTGEVLPSIRKNGMYATAPTLDAILNDPGAFLKTLQVLQEEKQKRKDAEIQIRMDAPKVAFANAVSVSDSTILIGDFAKILNQKGYDIGPNRLHKWMRDNGYLISRSGTDYNNPTQRAMELGLFKLKETLIQHGDRSVISITPKLTGKGQLYFINKFLKGKDE